MTSECQWEDDVLRVLFKHLVNQKLVLPPGPPASAPFDQGKWSLEVSEQKKKGWIMCVEWDDHVLVRARDVSLDWKVTNPADQAQPEPIVRADRLGDAFVNLSKVSSYDVDPWDWNVQEHVRTGSLFELKVVCPSLAERGRKAKVAGLNSQLFGRHTTARAFAARASS